MTATAKSVLAALVITTILVFYETGIDAFPDYANYLVIAENQGSVFEGDYLFEGFSRFILSLESVNPVDRVELLAFLNQLGGVAYFSWLACKEKSPKVFGGLFLFCLFGFMFMTTTLRASVAYLCISAFFLREGRFDFTGVSLLVLSMAWHDSALPIVLMYVLAFGTSQLVANKGNLDGAALRFLQFTILMASAIVVLAESLRPMLADLSTLNVGARAAYFDGDEASSPSKMVFVLLGLMSSLAFIGDSHQTSSSRIFMSLLALVVALFYLVNETLGVRFVFFIFAIALPLRDVIVFDFEKTPAIRALALLVSPLVYYLSILYTFSNTAA